MGIHVYPNWKTNINSKNCRRRSFSYETETLKSFIPMRWMCLWCLNMTRKEIIMWIHVYHSWKININLKIVEREVSLLKLSHQYHLSQWGVCVYGPQSRKKKTLSCEFVFNPIEKRTLILKMIEREVFLMKPKHQYCLS